MRSQQPRERLAPLLEAFCQMPHSHRIEKDPLAIVRRYRDPLEIETVGFLTASLAYGSVSLFKKVVEKILSLADGSFYRYLLTFDLSKERHRFQGISYRFSRSHDLLGLIYLMSRIIQQYGAIKPLFLLGYREEEKDICPALSRFIEKIKQIDLRPVYKGKKPSGFLYFFPSPDKGSACKRLHLYLRWMVRPDDGIDFGLWPEILPSQLIVPLDLHVARIGSYLGLTSRKTPDLRMAREITENLKRLDPSDPVKYDFSLCHHGISGDCPREPDAAKCRVCPLQPACRRGQRLS